MIHEGQPGWTGRSPARAPPGADRDGRCRSASPRATKVRASLAFSDSRDLNFSTGPVWARMPGGVGGLQAAMAGPNSDSRMVHPCTTQTRPFNPWPE